MIYDAVSLRDLILQKVSDYIYVFLPFVVWFTLQILYFEKLYTNYRYSQITEKYANLELLFDF